AAALDLVVALLALVVEHELVLEARAAASHHLHAQRVRRRLAVLIEQALDLAGRGLADGHERHPILRKKNGASIASAAKGTSSVVINVPGGRARGTPRGCPSGLAGSSRPRRAPPSRGPRRTRGRGRPPPRGPRRRAPRRPSRRARARPRTAASPAPAARRREPA